MRAVDQKVQQEQCYCNHIDSRNALAHERATNTLPTNTFGIGIGRGRAGPGWDQGGTDGRLWHAASYLNVSVLCILIWHGCMLLRFLFCV